MYDLLVFKCFTSFHQLYVRHQQRTACLGPACVLGFVKSVIQITKTVAWNHRQSSLGVNIRFLVSWGCSDFGLSCCRCRLFQGELQALVQTVVIMKCGSPACSLRISLRSRITAAFGLTPQQEPFFWNMCQERKNGKEMFVFSRACQVFDTCKSGVFQIL